MSSFRANLVILLSAALMASPAFATRTHRSIRSSSGHARTSRRGIPKSHKLHGHKQAIEPERVTQIQQALIQSTI